MDGILSHLQCLSLSVWTERESGPAFVIKSPVVLNSLSEETRFLLWNRCLKFIVTDLPLHFLLLIIIDKIFSPVRKSFPPPSSYSAQRDQKSREAKQGGLNLVSTLYSLCHSPVQKEGVTENKGSSWMTVLHNTVPGNSTQLRWKAAEKLLLSPWNSTTPDCQSAEHSPPATLRTHCMMVDFVCVCVSIRPQQTVGV